MMLQKNTNAHVKGEKEFHWGLEATLCLGFMHNFPHLQWSKSNREIHQEPATSEDTGLP